MSALGHQRTSRSRGGLSALPPKADINEAVRMCALCQQWPLCVAAKKAPPGCVMETQHELKSPAMARRNRFGRGSIKAVSGVTAVRLSRQRIVSVAAAIVAALFSLSMANAESASDNTQWDEIFAQVLPRQTDWLDASALGLCKIGAFGRRCRSLASTTAAPGGRWDQRQDRWLWRGNRSL